MAQVDEQQKWGAVKVRQTFLDYFEKNGHTFGMACQFYQQLEALSYECDCKGNTN